MGNMFKGGFNRRRSKIIKIHPKYNELRNDWDIKTDDQFYASVVYAYIVDCILNENAGNQEITKKYNQVIGWSYSNNPDDPSDKSQYRINTSFLEQYEDYLIELKYPGIHERAKKEKYQELIEKEKYFESLEQYKQVEAQQAARKEQQDLASGKRVICPYCKSTNTEKISTVSRAVSVSLVGAASGKLGKQWHCKNCGSNF